MVLYSLTTIWGGSVLSIKPGSIFSVNQYVQPGVTIDYKDGSNKADPNHKKVVSADEFVITGGNTGTSVDRSAPLQTDREATYILNKNSKKFHLPTCDSVTDMKEKNKEYSTKTREEMIADGYDPCKRCNP
jgi:DNA-entry nuclease